MILPSSLVIFQGWGLIDLPLRASNEGELVTTFSEADGMISIARIKRPSLFYLLP
jgi:hypothetical protein